MIKLPSPGEGDDIGDDDGGGGGGRSNGGDVEGGGDGKRIGRIGMVLSVRTALGSCTSVETMAYRPRSSKGD